MSCVRGELYPHENATLFRLAGSLLPTPTLLLPLVLPPGTFFYYYYYFRANREAGDGGLRTKNRSHVRRKGGNEMKKNESTLFPVWPELSFVLPRLYYLYLGLFFLSFSSSFWG